MFFEKHNQLLAKSIIECLSDEDLKLQSKIKESSKMQGLEDRLPYRMEKVSNYKFTSKNNYKNIDTYINIAHNIPAHESSFAYLKHLGYDAGTTVHVLLAFSKAKDLSAQLEYFENLKSSGSINKEEDNRHISSYNIASVNYIGNNHFRLANPNEAQEIISLHKSKFPGSKINDVYEDGNVHKVWRKVAQSCNDKSVILI